MNATEKCQPSASDGARKATTGTGDVASVPVAPRQAVDDPHRTAVAKTRGRCPRWLSDDCRGGPECRCLPPASTEPSTKK